MSVETVYDDGALLYVSNGAPDPHQCLWFASDGLAFRQGEREWKELWQSLEAVDFKNRGTFPSKIRARGIVAGVRWIVAAFAALLFAATFGGLGGSLLPGRGSLEVTLYLKGKPSAFALTYGIAIKWPPAPTKLDELWFAVVVDRVVGRDVILDVVGLADLLERAVSVSDLQQRLPQVIRNRSA